VDTKVLLLTVFVLVLLALSIAGGATLKKWFQAKMVERNIKDKYDRLFEENRLLQDNEE
jgi:hypothetical protein